MTMLNQYLPVQKTPKWLASILPDNFEQQPLALNKILPKSFFIQVADLIEKQFRILSGE